MSVYHKPFPDWIGKQSGTVRGWTARLSEIVGQFGKLIRNKRKGHFFRHYVGEPRQKLQIRKTNGHRLCRQQVRERGNFMCVYVCVCHTIDVVCGSWITNTRVGTFFRIKRRSIYHIFRHVVISDDTYSIGGEF